MDLFRLAGRIAIDGVNEANRDIDSVTSTAEKSESRMTKAFKKIGMAVAAAFTIDKIKNFGIAAVETAAEVDAEISAFAQIMGDYSGQASAKVQKIADATGMVATRLTPYMTSMSAKFKGLGYNIEDATDYATRGLNLAADAAAFWDKSLDDSMGALNSFINGSYEGGEAIGLFANDTQMAAFAVEQGVVKDTKAWAALDEKTKQATRLEYAENMFKLSGATGQAAKESGQYANVMANLKESWRQFKAEIGAPLLQNVVLPAMKALGNVITNQLIPSFQRLKDWVAAHTEQLKTFATVVGIATTAVLGLVGAWKAGLIIQKLVQTIQRAQVQLALYSMQTGGASIAQGLLNGQLTIGQVIVGVLTGKITLSTLATRLWTAAQNKLNVALTANPIGLVIAAIAALIAFLIIAYKKSEDFRNAVKNLWNEIKAGLTPVIEALKPLLSAIIDLFKAIWSIIAAVVMPIFNLLVQNITNAVQIITPILKALLEVFNAVFQPIIKIITTVINLISKIAGVITNAVNAVKNGISKIKDLFNFKWSLPKLKLPHFKFKGKFSLSPLSVPKLSVDWYKKAMDNGMILNEATIFGMNSSGQLMGAGEAGSETVVGTNSLMSMINSAVQQETNGLSLRIDKLLEMLATFFPQVLENMDQDIVLNDGALVGRLAPKMNEQFSNIQKANMRGR